MAEFMLMFTYGPAKPPPPLPEEELQAVIARYVARGERIAAEGHASPHRGARLSDVHTDPGRVVTSRKGEFVVTEGPLAETKEVVGGYGVIEAADYDEAAEVCRDHPLRSTAPSSSASSPEARSTTASDKVLLVRPQGFEP